jgi:hypothetical protein
MLSRLLFLLSLMLGSTVFLTGAWTGSFATSARSPKLLFVPGAVPLDADLIGSGLDARQLLQKALEKLAGQDAAWMKTKIRQTMADADSNFVAEGFLQRGPNHCAHLEMDVVRAGKRGRLLVVSDGEIVARVRKMPDALPVVVVERLPALAEDSQEKDAGVKEEFLARQCCGGPAPLLAPIHKHLRNARLRTGLLQDTPVIQIQGELSPDSAPVCIGAKNLPSRAHVYLDAQTLWPIRLEWWGVDRTNSPQVVLRVEFLEPSINRELSVAECMRMFSYRPDGD